MIDQAQLALLIKQALDNVSQVEIDPAVARQQQANAIAAAVAQFVIGRQTLVTGTSASGGPVTGTGVIQ
ncbi:MAG: hypothetical protein CVU03_05010 [Bacteroidetes bacterium HGW-Bacteroidetes-2]|jgi:hypothetical protein|nr:MAG: hypothetical protein CVU03_05010 [Bacteroidetes bacterium HGW-Bacteroidetes-2]